MLSKDQLNRDVEIITFPKKIISLVPSQTEFLADLGLEKQISGITKFCSYPEHLFKSKTHIGGTKTVDFEKIKMINPDLIIGNKEENDKSQLSWLMENYPVWVSDVRNLDQAFKMMLIVGEITGKKDEAWHLVNDIKLGFEKLNNDISSKQGELKSAVYLIWQNPYMTINKDTFIDDMMNRSGFTNPFRNENSRYPEITVDDIKEKNPEYILLSSEPFPFKEKHRIKLEKEFPEAKILLVNGTFFSWYGSRLKQTPLYLQSLYNRLNQFF